VIASINGLNAVVKILKPVKNLVDGLIVKLEDLAVESLKNQEVVTRLVDQRKLNVIKLKARCTKRPVLKELTGKKINSNK
jgi:hypothetical protein